MGEATLSVTFTPSGRRGRVPAGSTALEAGRMLGVDIDSVCGGRGLCGRCQITLGSQPGLPAEPGRLSPPEALENSYRGRRPLLEGYRLSCAARLLADAVIDVPPGSRVRRQVVRKRPETANFNLNPVVRLHYVEVEEPSMNRSASDLTRLREALRDQWDLPDLEMDPSVLQNLQEALRAGKWTATVSIHHGRIITGIWPGFRDRALGAAFDVGSTTVAGHLCDLSTGEILASEGIMNPQIRFGEDLMSRISYVMMNEDGAARLTETITAALNELVGELTAAAGAERADVLEITLVGNPIMHHLVLGIDPRRLGEAPFALATDRAVNGRAERAGFAVHPGARLYALPCVAGHVGADAAGAVLSEAPHRSPTTQLLVDVGTNAEIVLGGRERLLAASSPTGPAFEGAEISSGQRASPGAIERVRVDRKTLEPRFKVIDVDPWSDEEGFADAVRSTGVTGVCGSGIIEAVAELALSGAVSADGRMLERDHPRLGKEGRTPYYLLYDGPARITVTQTDVRAVQLAKAALYAGIRLLMDRLGVEQLDEIRLAGAFGSHIDPLYAMALGMIPDCDPARVKAAGNAAGTGAIMTLLSADARREIEELAVRIEKVETAVEPRFQEHFVQAMAIPHRSAPYPHLSRALDISGIPAASADRPQRRRARRPAPAAAAAGMRTGGG